MASVSLGLFRHSLGAALHLHAIEIRFTLAFAYTLLCVLFLLFIITL